MGGRAAETSEEKCVGARTEVMAKGDQRLDKKVWEKVMSVEESKVAVITGPLIL